MRVVHGKAMEGKPLLRNPRTSGTPNVANYKRLLQGQPGSPQNYEFSRIHRERYVSPRHRHNFDQLRFCVDGVYGDGKGQDLRAGHVGYYPEGAYYSIDAKESTIYILQFGGAGGSGFMSYDDMAKGQMELEKMGEFKEGIFYRNRGANLAPGTKLNQDAYEAIWQQMHGRRIEYPKPRYAAPILMDPANYAFIEGESGIARKTIGIFTERLTEASLIEVEAGATLVESAPRAPRIIFVLRGAGEAEGEEWVEQTAAELMTGETATLKAKEDMLLGAITLPAF